MDAPLPPSLARPVPVAPKVWDAFVGSEDDFIGAVDLDLLSLSDDARLPHRAALPLLGRPSRNRARQRAAKGVVTVVLRAPALDRRRAAAAAKARTAGERDPTVGFAVADGTDGREEATAAWQTPPRQRAGERAADGNTGGLPRRNGAWQATDVTDEASVLRRQLSLAEAAAAATQHSMGRDLEQLHALWTRAEDEASEARGATRRATAGREELEAAMQVSRLVPPRLRHCRSRRRQ